MHQLTGLVTGVETLVTLRKATRVVDLLIVGFTAPATVEALDVDGSIVTKASASGRQRHIIPSVAGHTVAEIRDPAGRAEVRASLRQTKA